MNQQYSSKALDMLSRSLFQSWLVTGVPQSTIVSHKFGERNIWDGKQLHDCGIVYYPSNPYILCVMTRGYDYDTLAYIIQNISKSIYDEVDSQYQ